MKVIKTVTYEVNRPLQFAAILVSLAGMVWTIYLVKTAQYFPSLFFSLMTVALGIVLADKAKKKRLPNKFT